MSGCFRPGPCPPPDHVTSSTGKPAMRLDQNPIYRKEIVPWYDSDIACMALIGYLLLSVLIYVQTYVEGVFKISYGKLGPTEVRVILMILNTVMFFLGTPTFSLSIGEFSVYDPIVALIAAVLIVIFTVSTIQKAQALAALGE